MQSAVRGLWRRTHQSCTRYEQQWLQFGPSYLPPSLLRWREGHCLDSSKLRQSLETRSSEDSISTGCWVAARKCVLRGWYFSILNVVKSHANRRNRERRRVTRTHLNHRHPGALLFCPGVAVRLENAENPGTVANHGPRISEICVTSSYFPHATTVNHIGFNRKIPMEECPNARVL